MMIVGANEIARNDVCHCGSGKKYKRCCLEVDERKRNPKALNPAGRQAVMCKILQDAYDGEYKIKFEDLDQIPLNQALIEHYDPVEDAFIIKVVEIKRQKLVLPHKKLILPSRR